MPAVKIEKPAHYLHLVVALVPEPVLGSLPISGDGHRTSISSTMPSIARYVLGEWPDLSVVAIKDNKIYKANGQLPAIDSWINRQK